MADSRPLTTEWRLHRALIRRYDTPAGQIEYALGDLAAGIAAD